MTDEEYNHGKEIGKLEAKVDTILGNHLPHLSASIKKVDDRTWWIMTAVLVMGILGIATAIFLQIVIK